MIYPWIYHQLDAPVERGKDFFKEIPRLGIVWSIPPKLTLRGLLKLLVMDHIFSHTLSYVPWLFALPLVASCKPQVVVFYKAFSTLLGSRNIAKTFKGGERVQKRFMGQLVLLYWGKVINFFCHIGSITRYEPSLFTQLNALALSRLIKRAKKERQILKPFCLTKGLINPKNDSAKWNATLSGQNYSSPNTF